MRGFHVVLPTLAPDYSGAASALYELGGAVVVHDPSGCLGNFVGYDEPRLYDTHSRVFTSALDEMQALLGKDEALVFAATQAQQITQGAFVAIVGTPNPMILGTDYAAVARLVSERCGAPAFGIETTGLDSYEAGASKAYLGYARAVLAPAVERRFGKGAPRWSAGASRRVNLLGATPHDMQRQANVDEAARILGDAGWEVASCWSMGPLADPAALVEGAASQLNVVLAYDGLALAKWMRSEYGIPYVWGCLAGAKGAARCLDEMEALAAGGHPAGPQPAPAEGPRALVVADQVMGEGMRRSLVADRGFSGADVVSPYRCERAAMAPGDAAEADEEDLAARIRSDRYALVAGDPLLTGFADEGSRARFALLPQAAISSRLHWDDDVCPFGEGFLAAVDAARPAGERAGRGLREDDELYDPRAFSLG